MLGPAEEPLRQFAGIEIGEDAILGLLEGKGVSPVAAIVPPVSTVVAAEGRVAPPDGIGNPLACEPVDDLVLPPLELLSYDLPPLKPSALCAVNQELIPHHPPHGLFERKEERAGRGAVQIHSGFPRMVPVEKFLHRKLSIRKRHKRLLAEPPNIMKIGDSPPAREALGLFPLGEFLSAKDDLLEMGLEDVELFPDDDGLPPFHQTFDVESGEGMRCFVH